MNNMQEEYKFSSMYVSIDDQKSACDIKLYYLHFGSDLHIIS